MITVETRGLPVFSAAARIRLTDLSLSRREAPVPERQSGAPLAATNVKTAGSVCKRPDAVRLGRKEGLQPRASERPAVGCSEKLASGFKPFYGRRKSSDVRIRKGPSPFRSIGRLQPPECTPEWQHNVCRSAVE